MPGTNKVKMFFFPHIAGGHLLPMIDTARFIASHPDVQVTIITTPKSAQLFEKAVSRDREAGHDISFHIMDLPKAKFGLPDDVENFINAISKDLRSKVFEAVLSLRDPLLELLRQHRPHCLVSDITQHWTVDVAIEAGIPRISFRVRSLFAICAGDALRRFKSYENVSSDDEPFALTGLPDEVYFTRAKVPECNFDALYKSYFDEICKKEEKSYGVIVNSFHALEPQYVKYAKEVMGKKRLYMVGPVSEYSNKSKLDKSERGTGKNNVQDDGIIFKWLDTKPVNSVLYVSFGSEVNICKEQFNEIANGLERSGQSFIWAARPNLYKDQDNEGWFPEGFEDRIKESKQGLIIKGWVPQLLILAHQNVGAFLNHAGWNSVIEAVSNGVPMITWPLWFDQFYNESLLVDVLKIAIRVGTDECQFMNVDSKPKVTVTSDKIEKAVKRMMAKTQEVEDMRKRVQCYAEAAKKAVDQAQCGTSYLDVCAMVEDVKATQNLVCE